MSAHGCQALSAILFNKVLGRVVECGLSNPIDLSNRPGEHSRPQVPRRPDGRVDSGLFLGQFFHFYFLSKNIVIALKNATRVTSGGTNLAGRITIE